MLGIEAATYSPSLRWKKGEYLALSSLDEPIKDHILPHIIIPPLSARDTEQNRKLSQDEFFPVQIGRIAKHWGRRTCLLDTRFVEFASGHVEDGEKLFSFLNATFKFGCAAIPMFDLETSLSRLDAIRRHWLETQCGLALRISFLDLGRENLLREVQKLLLKMVVKPSQVVLVFDLSGAEFDDVEEAFAASMLVWVNQLQEIGIWRRIVVTSSAYPIKNPAPVNGEVKVPRKEWKIWQKFVTLDERIVDFCMFGDFGADNSRIIFKGGGRPITHLRYALSSEWLVVRGGPSSNDIDGTLKKVSQNIVASGFFAGELFSAGDEFIADCAAGRRSLGGASEWRSANMNHHMTRVIIDLASSATEFIPLRRTRRAPVQGVMAL